MSNFEIKEDEVILYEARLSGSLLELNNSIYLTLTSKRIIIECGKLTDEQVEWYKKIYYYGLGEFRYINNIDT